MILNSWLCITDKRHSDGEKAGFYYISNKLVELLNRTFRIIKTD